VCRLSRVPSIYNVSSETFFVNKYKHIDGVGNPHLPYLIVVGYYCSCSVSGPFGEHDRAFHLAILVQAPPRQAT